VPSGVIGPVRLAAVFLVVLIPTGAAATPRVDLKLVTGARPCGIASGFKSLWVANDGAGTLVRIDPVRNRIVRRIRIAQGICPVATAGTSVWVASYRTDTVYRVSPKRGRVVGRMRVSHWPAHFAVGYGSVWISNHDHGLVLRLDQGTGRLTRAYKVRGNPAGLAFASDSLWVALGRDSTLVRVPLDGGTFKHYGLGYNGPGWLTAVGDDLWTTTADGYAVRFDPREGRVAASIRIPGTPADVGVGADGMIWVAEKERDTVTRIDPLTNRILDVTPAGDGAFSLAVAGGATWVTNYAGRDVWRFR
jgi:streptogramin lyase